MSPFISYPDMKIICSIKIIDLRHQLDLSTSKKVQLFHEHGADIENARFFYIIIRRREIEIVSDGNKLIEVKVI